jgi:sec-independent protein translocase protein TatB
VFDIGFSELFVIGVVALIVLGPERLPRVARTAGHLLGRLQRYVAQVKTDISREMELSELRKLQSSVEEAARSIEHTVKSEMDEAQSQLREAESELAKAEEEIRRATSVPVPEVHMGTFPQVPSTPASGSEAHAAATPADGAAHQAHTNDPEPADAAPQLELGLESASESRHG